MTIRARRHAKSAVYGPSRNCRVNRGRNLDKAFHNIRSSGVALCRSRRANAARSFIPRLLHQPGKKNHPQPLHEIVEGSQIREPHLLDRLGMALLAAYRSASISSARRMDSGCPMSNQRPWCTMPYSRPCAIARSHSRLVEKGPDG